MMKKANEGLTMEQIVIMICGQKQRWIDFDGSAMTRQELKKAIETDFLEENDIINQSGNFAADVICDGVADIRAEALIDVLIHHDAA